MYCTYNKYKICESVGIQSQPLDLSMPRPPKRVRMNSPAPATRRKEEIQKTPENIDSQTALDLSQRQNNVVLSGTPPIRSDLGSARTQIRLLDTETWLEFGVIGTEMIINPPGRRMFPYVTVELKNLENDSLYNVYIDVVPVNDMVYQYVGKQWTETSPKVPKDVQHSVNPNKPHRHPDSPKTGGYWATHGACFKHIKLTNRIREDNNEKAKFFLRSLTKYVCSIFVEKVQHATEHVLTNVERTRVDYVTLPETRFIAVTAYQNETITKMKIDANPFARAFKDKRNRSKNANGNAEKTRTTPATIISPQGPHRLHDSTLASPVFHGYPYPHVYPTFTTSSANLNHFSAGDITNSWYTSNHTKSELDSSFSDSDNVSEISELGKT